MERYPTGEQEFKEANGPAKFATDNGPKRVLEEIHQDTVTGFYIHELITSGPLPTPVGERGTDRAGPRRVRNNHSLSTAPSTRGVETNQRFTQSA